MRYAIVLRSKIIYIGNEPTITIPPEGIIVPTDTGQVGDIMILTPIGIIAFRPPRDTDKINNADLKTKLQLSEFMLRFTKEERIAIRACAQQDGDVDDFWSLVTTFRLIDITDLSITKGIDLLVDKQLVLEQRKPEILAIVPYTPDELTNLRFRGIGG